MNKKSEDFSNLREQAERILDAQAAAAVEKADFDHMGMIYELQVHQVELECQNEELRGVQKELEDSRNQYYDLYESAPVGFVTLTPKGLVTRANRAATEMLSGSGELLTGRGFSIWIHLEDRNIYLSCLKEAAGSRDRSACEVRLTGKSQRLFYVHLEAKAHFDAAGILDEWRLSFTDITGRKSAEEALHKSEVKRVANERTRAILESITDGFMAIDPEWHITYFNETGARMLGMNRGDLIGGCLWDLFPHATSSKFHSECNRALETQTPVHFEAFYPEPLNLWIEVHCYPSSDGLSVYFRDITERKLIEGTQSFLAQSGWAASGEGFFHALARYLGESLAMDYVCIDRLEGDQLSARTLAIYFDGKVKENVVYQLRDTPCGEVVKDHVCCFPKKVRHLFPDDLVLQEMKAESYVGTILWDSRGQPIGLIAVIGRHPLTNPSLVESILRLVSIRAAGELERKQAEDEIRELSQRLSYHVENSPLAVIEWGPDMRLIRWSREAERMFGWRAEEVLGKRMEDFRWIYSEDQAKVAEVSLQLLSGEDKLRFSANRNYRKDGSVIYCEWYNSSLLDDSGNLRSILSRILDVTERKLAEEAVEEARRCLGWERNLLQSIIDRAENSHLAYMDRDFNFVRVNEAYARTCGYTPEEMVGKNHFALFPHEENETIFTGVRDSGAPAEFRDKPFVFPDQPERGVTYWDWTLTPVKDIAGAVEGLVLSLFETTEHKRVEEALLESKELFEKTFISQLDAIFLLDACIPPKIMNCNPAAVKMFGYDREEMLGRTIGFLHADEGTLHRFQKKLYPAIEERGFLQLSDFEMKRKDEEIFPTEHSVIPLQDDEGRRTGWVSVIRDISERKRAERELRHLNETLEQQVAERTKLAEHRAEQLRILVAELTLAEERERRRLADILHDDLQQLLVAAKMNAEMISTRIGKNHKPGVEKITDLICQSLHTSRSLTTELSPPALRQGRLSPALEWLAHRMQKSHGLTVKWQIEPEIAPVGEDIGLLIFRSIRELLFNVVKHAGVKSAQVNLSCSGDHMLRAAVIDEGVGFDAGTTWENPKGKTGLGLFSIRERLEMIGGTLEVKSSTGKGAAFILVVPLMPSKEQKPRL